MYWVELNSINLGYNCAQKKLRPNQGVQRTPLARLLGWARFTRQNAPACWRPHNAQPSDYRTKPQLLAIYGSAARALPGSCLLPASSTLHTPASGAADARRWAARSP